MEEFRRPVVKVEKIGAPIPGERSEAPGLKRLPEALSGQPLKLLSGV